METIKKLKTVVAFGAVAFITQAGMLCWVGAQEPKTVEVEKPVEVEVEKIVEVIETIQVEKIIEVPPDDYYFYREEHTAQSKAEQAHWSKCMTEYPIATQAWLYLTETCGYNNYVAAGIMGNMMNECGGNTLALNATIYGGNKAFYGLCQWAKIYHKEVYGKSLEKQLEYLWDTLPDAMNNSGWLYSRNFDYNDFCNLQDSCKAALAFMKVYERPSSLTTQTRQMNALKAYQYFVIN